MKNADIFLISAQNIDCGYSLEPPRRGGSNEYQQSMVLSRNKKNDVYPYKPQFYYIKVGFKKVKIIWVCFRDGLWSDRTDEHAGFSLLWKHMSAGTFFHVMSQLYEFRCAIFDKNTRK